MHAPSPGREESVMGRSARAWLARALRAAALRLAGAHARVAHPMLWKGDGAVSRNGPFHPGVDPVPYAGRVFDEQEVAAAVGASLDFWLTLGPEGEAMERELAGFLGVKRSLLVNSGSSANLLAIAALTSSQLGDRRLRPGDEVITAAAGFPTTVAPIIQNGLVPVFVDTDPVTLNARADQLEDAFVEGKTKAVMMAHTLGNPFDLTAVSEFCKRHDLWLIEDNCDALGSLYDGKQTGAFGDLSTQSFYPPHHVTMGEGGAVNVVHDMKLKVLVESFRDWGRDCWCASGKDDTCGKRFGWKLGELPEGYDHKYIYRHLGYNLKPLDIQAAIGRAQLKKLSSFTEARKRNWETLRRGLVDLENVFDFQLPTHAKAWTPPSSVLSPPAPRGTSPTSDLRLQASDLRLQASDLRLQASDLLRQSSSFTWDASGHRTEPSWFGFMLRVRPSAPFSRTELARALDAAKIGNRMLFGGNLVRQPAFVQLRKDHPAAFRVVGDLKGSDAIMNEVLFVGVYPGLTGEMLGFMVKTIRAFVEGRGLRTEDGG